MAADPDRHTYIDVWAYTVNKEPTKWAWSCRGCDDARGSDYSTPVAAIADVIVHVDSADEKAKWAAVSGVVVSKTELSWLIEGYRRLRKEQG